MKAKIEIEINTESQNELARIVVDVKNALRNHGSTTKSFVELLPEESSHNNREEKKQKNKVGSEGFSNISFSPSRILPPVVPYWTMDSCCNDSGRYKSGSHRTIGEWHRNVQHQQKIQIPEGD